MNEHVKQVCKIGQGPACCRYLLFGLDGWECAKMNHDTGVKTLRHMIDGTVPESMTAKEIIDRNVASGASVSAGDNCEGKTVEFLNSE